MSAVRRSAFLVLVALGACSRGNRADPDFNTDVAKPAYAAQGPRVLFDEAHHNIHTATGKYRPFVKLIEADGYRVSRNRRKIAPAVLEETDLLVIANALGTGERNDDPALAPAEGDAIRDWVHAGGSLLLITDHYPTGDAVEDLATRLGVGMSKGVVEDSLAFDPAFDPTHIVFSDANGGLIEHPITRGRDHAERVHRILTFTGQALLGPPDAVSFLRLGPGAVARPAEPVTEHRGKDVLVNVIYGDPVPAAGMAQGIAFALGRGRVVVLGEAAMLTAQRSRYDGGTFGMNVAGVDNRQLALNIVHWLSRLL